jgi:peptidoglycan/xylan/chitin deacetylase (PgdA/CDA1 family)
MFARRLILAYLLGSVASTPLLLWFNHPVFLAVLWTVAGFLFYIPSVIPNNRLFGPVITRFRTTRREVWLTIDDGPDPEDTPKILDLLSQYQVQATFFLIGKHAAQHPELVREILRQGHTLGNHTYTHPDASFWMANPSRLREEIDRCAEVLSSITSHVQPIGFRAPVGMVNLFVHPALRRNKLRLIGWSSRGFDAVWTDPEKIVNRIWQEILPGAIILVHEGNHPSGEPPVNPRSLKLLLERLKSAGYVTVIPSLDQLVVK